nr:MAG TPA: hypothetical protein [Caudoviricetes sp.]
MRSKLSLPVQLILFVYTTTAEAKRAYIDLISNHYKIYHQMSLTKNHY